MGVHDELAALVDQRGPTVVRLVGPGATGVAAGWARTAGVLASVAVGELPAPASSGALWLHDDCGARSVADMWITICGLEELDWTVVLTGRATDGGHPGFGTTLECLDPSGGTGWTQVAPIETDDIVEAIHARYDAGDIAHGIALLEALREVDPQSADELAWLEIVRLTWGGRYDDAERACHTLPERHRCPHQVRLAAASLAAERGDYRRVHSLCRLVVAEGPRPFARDAAFLAARARWAVGERVALPEPSSSFRRYTWLVTLAGAGDVDAQERLRAGIQVTDWRPGVDARESARTGRLVRAAEMAEAVRPSAFASLHMVSPLRGIVTEAAALVDHGEQERALERLLDAELQPSSGLLGLASHAMVTGRAACEAGHVSALTWATSQTARLLPAAVPDAAVVRRCLPTRGDPWCAVTWARAIAPFDTGTVVRDFVAGVPDSPVALGPYALDAPVGAGGMATVWRGKHVLTGAPVAVKLLAEITPTSLALFEREVDLLMGLAHPHIVAVLDRVVVDDLTELQSRGRVRAGQPALVMELLPGGGLERLRGRLTFDALRPLLLQMLDGLAYAHARGVIHRDIKPENVLLDANGIARITDFGLSAMSDRRVAGTPAYMAPEQFSPGPLTATADIYALGCTAWDLMVGSPPFSGRPSALAQLHASAALPALLPESEVPAGFEDWLRTCLAKAPRSRFPTAADAATALLDLGTAWVGEGATFDFDRPDVSARDPRTTLVFPEHPEWRPRLPTVNLFEHGDPPIIGQEQAMGALWDALTEIVLGGGQRRVDLSAASDQGASLLLRWVRRRAAAQGLQPESLPTRGALSIVDATGSAASDWDADAREPWLLVWRDPCPQATLATGRRLDPIDVAVVLMSRADFAPRVVAHAVTDAAGDPALAIAHVADWIDFPGIEPTGQGLVVRHGAQTGTRVATVLEARIAGWSPEELEAVRRWAVAIDRFTGDEARALAGDRSPALVGWGLNDTWVLPGAVRAVLAHCDEEAVRARFAWAASRAPDDRRRIYYRTQAEQTRECVDELAEAMSSLGPFAPAGEVEMLLDLHLLHHEPVRQMARAARADERELDRLTRDSNPDLAAWACYESAARGLRGRHEGPFLRRVTELVEQVSWPQPGIQISMLLLKAAQLDARAVERLVQRARRGTSHPLHLEQIDQAYATRHPEAPRLLQALVRDARTADVRRMASADLSDFHLQQRDFAGALRVLEHASGWWSAVPGYNRMVACLGLDRLDDAARTARREALAAFHASEPIVSAGFFAVYLLSRVEDATDPVWDTLLRFTSPVRDPLMAELLTAHIRQVAPGRRRSRLMELCAP